MKGAAVLYCKIICFCDSFCWAYFAGSYYYRQVCRLTCHVIWSEIMLPSQLAMVLRKLSFVTAVLAFL